MNNIVFWALRIFIGAVSVLLLGQAAIWSFFPEINMTQYGISAEGILGLNMIKSDIGAGLFATGLFGLLFLTNPRRWLLPVMTLVGAFLVIRLISAFTDGFHPIIAFGIGLEASFLVAVWLVHRISAGKSLADKSLEDN